MLEMLGEPGFDGLWVLLGEKLSNQGHSGLASRGKAWSKCYLGWTISLQTHQTGRQWWEPGRLLAPLLEAIIYSEVLPANCVTKYLPDPEFWPTFWSQIWNNKNQRIADLCLICKKTQNICLQEESGPRNAQRSHSP